MADTPQFQFDLRTVLSLLLIAAAYYLGKQLPRWMSGVPYLKPDKAKELLDAEPEAVILDVRMPTQFSGKDGHLKDALNLPLIDLMGRVPKLKADLAQYAETPVLVVCNRDQLASRAARILRKNGLKRVNVLAGGLKAWKKAGQPVETAAPENPA